MSAIKPTVVLIEDDPGLRRVLRVALGGAGFDVRDANSGRLGLDLAADKRPDLILLDLGLPDIDGVEIVKTLRGWWHARPIIVLSGRGSEADKVALLELGADDYLTKPFSTTELIARVRATLRRVARNTAANLTHRYVCGEVAVDLARREVHRAGHLIALTPNEYRVLTILIGHAGALVSTDTLVRELWGPGPEDKRRHYLRGYLANLRQKLEVDPANPRLLFTEAGVGYRLAESEPAETPAANA